MGEQQYQGRSAREWHDKYRRAVEWQKVLIEGLGQNPNEGAWDGQAANIWPQGERLSAPSQEGEQG